MLKYQLCLEGNDNTNSRSSRTSSSTLQTSSHRIPDRFDLDLFLYYQKYSLRIHITFSIKGAVLLILSDYNVMFNFFCNSSVYVNPSSSMGKVQLAFCPMPKPCSPLEASVSGFVSPSVATGWLYLLSSWLTRNGTVECLLEVTCLGHSGACQRLCTSVSLHIGLKSRQLVSHCKVVKEENNTGSLLGLGSSPRQLQLST